MCFVRRAGHLRSPRRKQRCANSILEKFGEVHQTNSDLSLKNIEICWKFWEVLQRDDTGDILWDTVYFVLHNVPRLTGEKKSSTVFKTSSVSEGWNVTGTILTVISKHIPNPIKHHSDLRSNLQFPLSSLRAIQDFCYVALVSIQVFLYCFWGNEVAMQSQEIAMACWNANFIGTDVRFQKNLVFVIRAGQKPIILTAGKFVPLSLATYVWVGVVLWICFSMFLHMLFQILRASYSYYMVLRNRGQEVE